MTVRESLAASMWTVVRVFGGMKMEHRTLQSYDGNLGKCENETQEGIRKQDARRASGGITNVAWCPVFWSGGVTSSSSAFRLPLVLVGVSGTGLRVGSVPDRGVRKADLVLVDGVAGAADEEDEELDSCGRK